MKKFCTRCGRQFEAVGREVICPSCKAAAAEEAKRAAVLKAKRASWAGEAVPVRISGRASTVIRAYGAANNMPFAEALDALLRTSDFFLSLDKAWVDITPYKSHRRDKHATQETAQDAMQKVLQDVQQEVKQDEVKQEVKQAAKKAVKTSTAKPSKAASKAASKASASK